MSNNLLDDFSSRFGDALTIIAPEPPAYCEPVWLSTFTREKRLFRRLREGIQGPFPEDEREYMEKCTVLVEYDVRVYRVPCYELSPIVVVEEYAARLDEIRDICRRGDSDSLVRMERRDHPLKKLARPEHLEPHMYELVDNRYIRQIALLDWDNPFDPWQQQVNKHNLRTLASAEADGSVHYYRADVDDYLGVNLKHEWCHRLEERFPELIPHFNNAVNLEWWEWTNDDSAFKSMGEQFAYLGQDLMERDGRRFLAAALKAPMRSVVFYDFLERPLQDTWVGGAYPHIWTQRVKFVREHLIPLAMSKSNERVQLATAAQTYMVSRTRTS
jgi:hypothetical protein